jgi:hypothetical protein
MSDRQSSSENDTTTAEGKDNDNVNGPIGLEPFGGQEMSDRPRMASIPGKAIDTLVHDREAIS